MCAITPVMPGNPVTGIHCAWLSTACAAWRAVPPDCSSVFAIAAATCGAANDVPLQVAQPSIGRGGGVSFGSIQLACR